MALLKSEFHAAMSRLSLDMLLKFAWRTNHPWILAGMAHPHVDRAVMFAKRCVALFSSTPEAQHHRKTSLFLKPGMRLRKHIDSFIATSIMHGELKLRCAIFLMIPLSDRPIERAHKYLSAIAKRHEGIRLGHNYASKSLLDVARLLEDPDFNHRLISAFMQLDTARQAVEAMGSTAHPGFQRLWERAAVGEGDQPRKRDRRDRHGDWRLLERIIYRQELAMKYERYPMARRQHAAAEAEIKKSLEVPQLKRNRAVPACLGDVLLSNSYSHLNNVAHEHNVIVAPVRMDGETLFEVASVEAMLFPEELLDFEVLQSDQEEVDGQRPSRQSKRHRLDNFGSMDEVVDDAMEENIAQAQVKDKQAFRVVSRGAGRVKTISTFVKNTGPKLQYDDIAVTFHKIVASSESEVVTCMQPEPTNEKHSSHVLIVNAFNPGSSFDQLKDAVVGWSHSKKLPEARYSFPIDADSAAMHDCIATVLRQDAVPGAPPICCYLTRSCWDGRPAYQ